MKKVYFVLTLVMLASLVLSACGGQPEPMVEEPAPVEEVVVEEAEEEVAEESESAEVAQGSGSGECCFAEPEVLDGVFGDMLSEMAKYNTIQGDGLLEEMAADTPPFILMFALWMK